MIDLKAKQREIGNKFKAIQQANELKTGVLSALDSADSAVENFQDQIASTLTSYSSSFKKKLPNTDNIFDKITRDLKNILPEKKENGESFIRKITRESINETSDSVKPIFLDNLRKLFAASDSELNCGLVTSITEDQLTISPKEFDYLHILQTDPQSGLGKIIYEGQVNRDKIKMNKVFFAWQELKKLLVDMQDGTHAERIEAYPPKVLMTDGNGSYARLRVDVGQTGFFAGREFRVC